MQVPSSSATHSEAAQQAIATSAEDTHRSGRAARIAQLRDFEVAIPRRDTRAWSMQVWLSFGIAVFLCATGLAWLPGAALDRAFMVMGYLFCLSAVFVLAKFVRDNEGNRADSVAGKRLGSADTPLWKLVVWGGFLASMALTAWGLLRMQIDDTYKAFLGVSWLFLVSSAFTLAKTLRDRHEVDVAEARAAA